MDCDDWLRIGDDKIAHFGVRDLWFASPDGAYRVHVDQSNQDWVEVEHDTVSDVWSIVRKEALNDWFKISGSAGWPLGVGGTMNTYWFELFLDDEPRIELWGDRVIARTDRLVTFSTSRLSS